MAGSHARRAGRLCAIHRARREATPSARFVRSPSGPRRDRCARRIAHRRSDLHFRRRPRVDCSRRRVEESGLRSGVAYIGDGNAQANMGVAIGDYDNDGLIDLLTTTFSEDYFPLFRQSRPGLYEDVSSSAGLGTITLPWVGWATGFTDFDNDGWKDLWLANGHVYPKADRLPNSSYLQPLVVMRNTAGRFSQEPGILDPPLLGSYRGGAVGDFNNDGKMDLVILPIDGPPLLLENDTQTHNNWIGLHLRGTRTNRDGIGAFVRVEACGKFQVDTVRNGGSYLSHDDPRLHFGLGNCESVERVVVRWQGGKEQVVSRPAINRYTTVREPLTNVP